MELANDLSPQDAKKIDKQIERMPHLKQVLVWHALVLPFLLERFFDKISCKFLLVFYNLETTVLTLKLKPSRLDGCNQLRHSLGLRYAKYFTFYILNLKVL